MILGTGFKTEWEAGNLSGKYEFTAKVSKEDDGRKFETEKTDFAILSVKDVDTEVDDTLAYKWKLPDNDIHYPFNKFMRSESIRIMERVLEKCLEKYIWTQEAREDVRFMITSANLYKGGFFDKPFGIGAGASMTCMPHNA